MEELVGADGRAQHRGVVTELTDLGRRLVDECQLGTQRPDRAGAEERIDRACVDETADGRLTEIETVPTDEEVETSRVASADLEPIERRQRDLHRVERLQRGDRRVGPGERADLAGRPQPVAPDGPHRVAGAHQRRVDPLELARGERGSHAAVELGLERVQTGREPLHAVTDHERGLRITEERPNPGHAPELAVDRLHRGRRRTQPLVQRGRRNHRSSVSAQLRAARTSRAGSGTARVARRRTTPTMPHMR